MNTDTLFMKKIQMFLMLHIKDWCMYFQTLFSKNNRYILNILQQLIQLYLSNGEGCVVTPATLLICQRFFTFTTYIDIFYFQYRSFDSSSTLWLLLCIDWGGLGCCILCYFSWSLRFKSINIINNYILRQCSDQVSFC